MVYIIFILVAQTYILIEIVVGLRTVEKPLFWLRYCFSTTVIVFQFFKEFIWSLFFAKTM